MKKKLQSKAKKILAIAAVASMLGSQFVFDKSLWTQEVYAAGFNMNGSTWAEPYLRSLYENGIMTGDTNGNMNPDKDIRPPARRSWPSTAREPASAATAPELSAQWMNPHWYRMNP